MASLTFNGIATRSGVSTATVHRYWTSRVDAVVDTITDAFAEFPVPDTGDLRADLETYLIEEQRRLGAPRPRAVIASSRCCRSQRPRRSRTSFDARLVRPLRARFVARLQAAQARGDLDGDIDIDVAADLLAGPVYYRALITGEGLDGTRVAPVLDMVLASGSSPARAPST